MKKAKNKQLRKYLLWGLTAATVAFLAVMPLLATPQEETDGPQASILSGSAQIRSIETFLRGGGNLESGSPETVELPSGVKITEFLVKNGDSVTEGTPLAAIDRVTLMEAIVQVQDTLYHLQKEMSQSQNDTVSSYIRATAGGRIKEVYAAEGDTVQEVMLNHGALALLSLDGLMAVTIERNMPLATGDSVCVILSNDSEVEGRVESNINGKITVTIDDEGYPIGESVLVTTDEGTRVGSGTLYAHNPWKVVGFTGTIKAVHAKAESTVYSGTNLFTLTDTDYTAQLKKLAGQHRQYEQLLQEMLIMYESGAILAPCDGLVSGIDTKSPYLLAAEEAHRQPQLLSAAQDSPGWRIVLLSNTEENTVPSDSEEITNLPIPGNPDEEAPDSWENLCTRDETCTAETHRRGCPMRKRPGSSAYTGWAASVILVDAESGIVWVMKNPQSITVTDPENPPEIDAAAMTEVTTITQTTYTDGSSLTAGDTVLLLEDGGVLKLTIAQGGTSGGTGGEGQEEETQKGEGSQRPSDKESSGRGDSSAQEPAFEPYPLEGTALMRVTRQEEMTVTITLDEQDIACVHPGQTALVQITPLRGQTLEGTVTKVSTHGTNEGGSSKFTVEVAMPMTENMLSGMSATVTIPLYSKMDILTIPVAALVENGTKTQVYTALDPETGAPASPVEVTTGVSDGETVEIVAGLSSGDSFYYYYYDTLEVSTEVERANRFGR